MSKLFQLGQALKKGDAKHRIFVILIVVIIIVFLIYMVSKLVGLQNTGVGDSRVTRLPNVDSVQGGKTSPAYRNALQTNNLQRAEQARRSGSSSIATIINTGNRTQAPVSTCSSCCNGCDGATAVDQTIADLLRSGKISPETADELTRLSNLALSPEDYAAELDRLVKEGKLTPEQARKLLAAYKKKHQDGIAQAGAKDLDPLVKDGRLSVDTAGKLLDLQQQDLSPDDYAAALQRMVDAGELTPEQAASLLAKYKAQRSARLASETEGQLNGMETTGEISPDVSDTLKALQDNNVPIEDYAATLDRLVKEGKLTPEQAKRLLAQYKKEHGIASGNSAIDAYANASELSVENGAMLQKLQANNVPVSEFANKLQQLVKTKQISTEIARQLMMQYQKEYSAKQAVLNLLQQDRSNGSLTMKGYNQLQQQAASNESVAEFSRAVSNLSNQGQLAANTVTPLTQAYTTARSAADKKDQLIAYFEQKKKLSTEAANSLSGLQNKGASIASYANKLQQLVNAGVISPDTAKALLSAYRARLSNQAASNNSDFTSAAIDGNFTASGNSTLDRVARAGAQQQIAAQQKSYTGAAALQHQKTAQIQQQQQQTNQLVQAKMQLMLAQAKQLVSANITPVTQTYVAGTAAAADAAAINGTAATQSGAGDSMASEPLLPPLIKAGSILYAVLDTAVNSDYPDSPVMATIVAGKFKGAKVLGSIKTVQNGQRVMLQFNTITENTWPTGKAINAYAIDPDTARTAVATDVNNHYLLRYGSIFAASFLQGLGEAVEESGTEVSSDDGVVTSSTEDLDTEETLLVALGTVGENMSGEVNKLAQTPPTVKVKAGVGIGILFMADVADGDAEAPTSNNTAANAGQNNSAANSAANNK